MVMPNHLSLAKGPETLSELDTPLKQGDYVHALKLLTKLSHQHIGLLQEAIQKIVADESMVDNTFTVSYTHLDVYKRQLLMLRWL